MPANPTLTDRDVADLANFVRDAGYPQLTALREQHAGPEVEEFEKALRQELGEGAANR